MQRVGILLQVLGATALVAAAGVIAGVAGALISGGIVALAFGVILERES